MAGTRPPRERVDDDGNGVGYFDVHDYIAGARAHYDKVGIGADYVDTLFR